MRIYCRTNLDEYRRTEWPTRFAFPPRVGDYIEGRGSDRPGMTRPKLRVASVTHRMSESDSTEAVVVVELHR